MTLNPFGVNRILEIERDVFVAKWLQLIGSEPPTQHEAVVAARKAVLYSSAVVDALTKISDDNA